AYPRPRAVAIVVPRSVYIRPMRFVVSFLIVTTLLACQSTNRLPDGSMIGTMTTQQLPDVQIDGRQQRLAPGARIVGANNTSITPNQVPPNSKVRYRVDSTGLVTHVWVLPPNR
ncbi:MAG: hypothetical protein ACRECQ_12585, partial [Burkholderiaceae bacterium]